MAPVTAAPPVTADAGPPVTVAVVSWNTRELLLRCLAALRDDVEAGRARVVVVDNASEDGSAAAVREHARWAEVIESPGNLGFGAAVNLVAARTSSAWLMSANADIAVTPGALKRMIAAADADPRIGAVAPRLILPGGRTQHSVGPFPTLVLALVFALGVHRISPALGDRLCLPDCWDAERARVVPWAVGACLLLRRTAFDAVGGFDARQWMYAEDLELGWRLHDAGWLTRYEPEAHVAHAEAAATTQAFGSGRTPRYMRATYEAIARRRGVTRARLTAAVNLAGTLARLIWMAPLALLAPGRRPALGSTWRWARAHRPGLRITVPATPVQHSGPPR